MSKKEWSWQDEKCLKEAVNAINNEKIIVGDTDTVPGLFAACTANGVLQLNTIKERSDKPYLLLIGCRDVLVSFIKQPLSPAVEKLAEHFWPGPLTLILPAQEDVPSYLHRHGGIAVRIPEHAYIRELAHQCKGVLSTSANLAGQETPKNVGDVSEKIMNVAALVLHNGTTQSEGQPSTILDATGDRIKVIREGAISIEMLEQVAGAEFVR